MKIVTYLGFTLLSVLIQFGVMDFIQGMLKLDEKSTDLKGTSQKRHLRDVLKDITHKPHALYYRTQNIKDIKNHFSAKFVSNSTLTELIGTTDITTTVFDVLYEENLTVTDDPYTTESLYTSTDFDNVTEITFIEKNNETLTKGFAPKKSMPKDCGCNFWVNLCDVNCCCDKDCLESEIDLFPLCGKNKSINNMPDDNVCLAQLSYFSHGSGLFCIVKINLPEKKHFVYQKTDQAPAEKFLTWRRDERNQNVYEYSNTIYKYADPIWLLKKGFIYHTDLPSPTVNNYCLGRKAIQFLKDENYNCIVKIHDLEMFQISKSLEEVVVISATSLSMNSSVLNCTNLYCVNWTITICNNYGCFNYNKDLHEPTCTESICTNLALKIEYTLYYHDSKITNATVKFHVNNVTMDLPFLSQEIQVKFVLANKSIDNVVKLSGNPGYLDGLPIIISYAEKNYTIVFYNNTIQIKQYLLLPENSNGVCNLFNSSDNFVLFGRNRRIKCRYNHNKKIKTKSNATEECKNIQNNIHKLFRLNNKILVSPLGNPDQLNDTDWVSVEKYLFEGSLFGRIQEKSSKLVCCNLITKYSIIFSVAFNNEQNRIVSCMYKTSARNTTFDIEDASTVITFDVSFIEVTKPAIIDHITGAPNLNIHLPDDFFYPFRSNESRLDCNVFTMILCVISLFTSCK